MILEGYSLFKSFIRLGSLYVSYRILKFLLNYTHRAWVYRRIPGRQITPLLGNLNDFWKKSKCEVFKQILQYSYENQSKPLFKIWFGTVSQILIHDPVYLEEIFEDAKFSDKGSGYRLLHPWLGEGLLTSNGEKWFHRRKLLTPAFHFDILKDFLIVFNEQSEIFIEKLKKLNENQSICLLPHITACTLDIICETAMGEHISAQSNFDTDYVRSIQWLCDILVQRHQQPWLRNNNIFRFSSAYNKQNDALKILHGFTRKVIKQRSENFKGIFSGSKKRIAFMDILLDAKMKNANNITDKDIQEEVDTFMFEGHDTTATGLYFTTYAIAAHPEVQCKLHKEIDDVLSHSNRQITQEDLSKLQYLDCVIKEALRLYPPVAFISRGIKKNTNIGEYRVLTGAIISIYIYKVNRNPKYFPQADVFNPDRFLPENSTDRHPYCYIPFSAGRRNCIGQRFAMMEMKIMIANILRNFELSCNQKDEELNFYSDLLLRTENEIKINLKQRN